MVILQSMQIDNQILDIKSVSKVLFAQLISINADLS